MDQLESTITSSHTFVLEVPCKGSHQTGSQVKNQSILIKAKSYVTDRNVGHSVVKSRL